MRLISLYVHARNKRTRSRTQTRRSRARTSRSLTNSHETPETPARIDRWIELWIIHRGEARVRTDTIGAPLKPTIKQPYLDSGSPLTETPSSHDAHPNCRRSPSRSRGPSLPRSRRCVAPPFDLSPFDQRRLALARSRSREIARANRTARSRLPPRDGPRIVDPVRRDAALPWIGLAGLILEGAFLETGHCVIFSVFFISTVFWQSLKIVEFNSLARLALGFRRIA